MFKHVIMFALSCYGVNFLDASGQPTAVTDIHVDPTVVFKTQDPSITITTVARFFAAHWRKPNATDLYAPLSTLAATSTVHTYKDGLPVPLVFSDLLTGRDPEELLSAAIQHLDSLKTTQNTALGAFAREIVTVLCSPKKLTDLHVPIKEHIYIFRQLKQQGYRLHLTGNYAYPEELFRQHGAFFKKYFHGCRLSTDMHDVKPSPDFFRGIDREKSLFIDTELHHLPRELELRAFAIPPQNGVQALLDGLKRNGITLEE